ncbi:hypothetical protein GS8_701 [Geobacillus stearothermophilus]|uniref:Uncharacterized protein n=1 Tax=Geobacillus stearothermophilus TaxID=1422 RepID=A0ABQ7HJP3_GEOSE|nr:hypothetical protein GS8_701 [Geobacillus stearothermophilus]
MFSFQRIKCLIHIGFVPFNRIFSNRNGLPEFDSFEAILGK